MGKSFANNGGDFMVVVQEMIKAEVRSNIVEMQRNNGEFVGGFKDNGMIPMSQIEVGRKSTSGGELSGVAKSTEGGNPAPSERSHVAKSITTASSNRLSGYPRPRIREEVTEELVEEADGDGDEAST